MSKKIYLLTIVCFLFCTQTLFATVIGDWEQTMEGWERVDVNDPNVLVIDYDDTYGVTLNDHSIYFHTNRTAQQILRLNLLENDLIEVFKNNLEVSLDVTRLAADWEYVAGIGSWNQFQVRIQAGQGDIDDVNDPNAWGVDETLPGNASWNPTAPTGDDPIHQVYDYSLVLGMIDFDNLEYLDIILQTNWGGDGYTSGGHYNVDNVRLQGGGPAYNPTPAHDERELSPEDSILLSWSPGVHGELHDVYFGTSPVDVAEATREDDRGVLRSRDQINSIYDPGPLEYSRSYHWRIDMINEADEILKGQVWTFTTPYLGPGLVMGDLEQTLDNWNLYPNATGEFEFSQTGATLGDYSLDFITNGGFWKLRWAGSPIDLRVYDTFRLDVSQRTSEFASGSWTNFGKMAINGSFGWKEISPAKAVDRNTGEPLENAAWGTWSGDMDRTISWDLSSVDWEAADVMNSTYFQVNLSIQNTGAEPGHFHLDNIRFINSREAHSPNPADTSTDIPRDTQLSWQAGSTATQRTVYWGSDPIAIRDVNQATIGDYPDMNFENTTELSSDPGKLVFSQKYHWRVDEIETNGTIWQGPVWSFTTGNYIVIEDFEDYNDISDDTAIWSVWLDGWLPNGEVNPDNGAIISTEVLDGTQGMNFNYDNTLAPMSEASREWDADQSNWAEEGMTTLSFRVRGFPESQGSITEATTDTYTIVGAGTDIWNTEDGCFFAYKTLKAGAGSITARVGAILPQNEGQSVHTWAKAGLMIRQTLDASSPNQFAGVTGGTGITNQYRLKDLYETKDGGRNDDLTQRPIWFRLERDAWDFITASYAEDNNSQPGTWTKFGEAQFGLIGEALIGFAISSNESYVPVQADISHVTYTGNIVGNEYASQEIGIHQNIPDSLYVTIKDGKGISATVQGDPQGLTNLDWSQQKFKFSDFTNVDFSDINSLLIGVGTPGGSASQANGIATIDDIRIHQD